eukprot:TRINITY_DN3374_c4_g1_i1.p1 TRINITY_DN3374_c4_g1~~TRINITY_DN3374_c4_g1_i1.p1  ORF type:complete len:307 (+),score=62.62 TRINITY_DN3374_c4_g1_i1:83-922(+)
MQRELRRKIAKHLVRDLTRASRLEKGNVKERILNLQIPCVVEFHGSGSEEPHSITDWKSFMKLPPMVERLVRENSEGAELRLDWEKFKQDIVEPMWCGKDAGLEKEAFDVLKFTAGQKELKEVSRTTLDNGVCISTMTGRVENGANFFFCYRITVENQTNTGIRLIARNLNFFTNENNLSASVQSGFGVVGHTPLLFPGMAFTWQSGCELSTPTGHMTGSLEFATENTDTWEKHKAASQQAPTLDFYRSCANGTFTATLPTIPFGKNPALSILESDPVH